MKKILITGASGFLGRRLCQALVDSGYPIGVLLRSQTNHGYFKALGAEIYYGDVRDPETLRKAFRETDAVVHAAAAQTGNREAFEQTTIKGTENVTALCREFGIRPLIYISSMSVYQLSGLKSGSLLTEDAPLEQNPQARGYYTWSKVAAEAVVQQAMQDRAGVPSVILRPATIYGAGSSVFSPMIGISLFDKFFLILGRSGMRLPFVYIDNLINAILLALENESAVGKIFNVIDDDAITKREYVKRLRQRLFPRALTMTLPYWFVYAAVALQEIAFKTIGKEPVLTRYRLSSASNDLIFSNEKIKAELGWSPKVSIDQGLEACFSSYRKMENGHR